MDNSKEVKTNRKTEEPSSSSTTAGIHIDIPIDVQVVEGIEQMSTTSSDSDIGTAESCSPDEISKESPKIAPHCANNTNDKGDTNRNLRTEEVDADLSMFHGFEPKINIETPGTRMSRSPSIVGNYSSSGESVFDLELHHDDATSFEHADIVLAPNINREIKKKYSPSLNRIRDELNELQQTPIITENPWEFFENNRASSSTVVAVTAARAVTPASRNRITTNQSYSVGIQVNNPEIGNFIHRRTECDWIRCMMCAVIVSCIITGLCAATVMILNTFFQYWLLP